MRPSVLHCYGDYKWTGPSEPIVQLCREQRRRGLAAELACIGKTRRMPSALEREARKAGLTVHGQFCFDSKPNVRRNVGDVRNLVALINARGYDLIHAHASWDHMLASVAARSARSRPPVR